MPAAWRRTGLALALAVAAMLTHAGPALGHASLIGSEPADRAVVARSPATLTLTFNEPVTPAVLRLVGAGGHVVALTDISAVDSRLVVRLPEPLPRGTHVLSWRVFSADGHPVGGALTFSVGEPSAAPGRPQLTSDPTLRAAIWLGKFLLYVGLMIGAGGAIYAGLIARDPVSPAIRRALVMVLLLGSIAAVISIGLQGVDLIGAPLSDLGLMQTWTNGLGTPYGTTAVIAAAVMLLALVAIHAGRRAAAGIGAVTLAGTGAALMLSGHVGTAPPQWLTRPAVLVHGIAVALWVGALIPLAAAMASPQRRTRELMRFSRVMPAVIVLLVASGATLAIVQVRAVEALWTTDYGLVLSGKLALVLLLLLIAAWNRYRLTPRVAAGESAAVRRLARNAAIECAVVLLVLALVALWRFTSPPRALMAAANAPVRAHIHSNQAMADVEIAPPQAGGRRITVSVLDGQFGPLAAKEVTLFLSSPQAGIERLRLPATRADGATWQIDAGPFPLAGRWLLRVEILVNDFEKVTLEDEIDVAR